MMVMKQTARLVVLLLLIFAFGCRDKHQFESVQTPVLLIDGIASYQSLDDFKAGWGAAYALEVSQDEEAFDDDRRPPFKFAGVLVRDFEHLGHKGELGIVFFNDRLAKTIFYPANLDEYLATLSSEIGSDVIVLDPENVHGIYSEPKLIRPHVRVFAGTYAPENQDYIAWEDERLADEITLWISRYS